MHPSRSLLTVAFGTGLCVLSLRAWPQNQLKAKPVAEIENYTVWHQVARERFVMSPFAANLCVSAGGSSNMRPTVKGKRGPHAKKFIRVFVNKIGDEQMITKQQPHFPVGSVIIKQKLPLIKASKGSKITPQQISPTPELLTVMIKREAGYDPANGDWEYMVTDGQGQNISERGKIESCQNCHRAFTKSDYVVRSYLPQKIAAWKYPEDDDEVGAISFR